MDGGDGLVVELIDNELLYMTKKKKKKVTQWMGMVGSSSSG